MRCTMIELLTWTYRDELPKRDRMGYGDGWGAVEAYGDGGGYDIEPMPRLPTIVGAPHPDAELVDRKVKALGPISLLDASSEGLAAAAEAAEILLGPIARILGETDYRAMARRSVHPPAALQSLALGVVRPPPREAWTPEPCRDAGGSVVQLGVSWRKESVRVEGRTIRLRVMTSGYCPVVWAPRPAAVFEERMRWHVLIDLMERLMAELAPQLTLWQVDGVGLPVEPWRGDVDRQLVGRLLPDLAPPPEPALQPKRGRRPKRALKPRSVAA